MADVRQAREKLAAAIGTAPTPAGPPGPPSPPTVYRLVQFAGPVVAFDARGLETLTDRARVGRPLCDHGHEVTAIEFSGWCFRVRTSDGATVDVPLINVRSAR